MDIDEKIVKKLISNYGDAFYLLDSKQFKKNFIELKREFSKIYPKFNIAYSYKTNYIPEICKIVNELGGYAEVVSEMELELAKKCGVLSENIIWNGPIKNPQKEYEFLKEGGGVNLDSLEEALLINEFAKKVDRPIRIGIRCNYDVKDGIISRFGLDVQSDDFKKVMEILLQNDNIHFVNFQCHFAKREIEYWKNRVDGMLDIIEMTGIVPERIDLGGGLFGKMEVSLKNQFSSYIPDYSEYAKVIATRFKNYFSGKQMVPELIIEPGSALIGDCMKFASTVKSIKKIRGKYVASVLGSQKNISMTGVNPPIQIIQLGKKRKKYINIDLVGYTCIENDVIYKDYTGELALDDVIIIGNCGSYSLVMKPPFILPNFPVLDIDEGKIRIVKRKEEFEDIFQTYVM